MAGKKPTLTVKEVKLIKALVSGKSIGQAGMIATGSTNPQSGATQAGRMLKSVDVQEALAVAFEKHGITLDAAIEPIGKALKATKVQITGQGDQAFAEVVEDIDLQLKGSDRALKLMNVGQDRDGGGNTYNFINVAKTDKDEFGL